MRSNCLRKKTPVHGHKLCAVIFSVLFSSLIWVSGCLAQQYRVGLLMAGDNRADPVKGFQEGLNEITQPDNIQIVYNIKNASGDRSQLKRLAAEIVASSPDIAIAAGGIEADALNEATHGNKIPVVFLAAASAVERGLVASMTKPGGNITGVDTNDTALTAKRLWYISKMLPEAKKILCLNIPSITPSVESSAIAREAGEKLGMEIQIIDVSSRDDVAEKIAGVSRQNTDLILLLPVAPTDQAVKTTLLPLSLSQKIPIMGYNQGSLNSGAFAAYGSSRFETGKQAARLTVKILRGANPALLPVESPDGLNLTINRLLVNRLGLKLTTRVWKLANSVIELQP